MLECSLPHTGLPLSCRQRHILPSVLPVWGYPHCSGVAFSSSDGVTSEDWISAIPSLLTSIVRVQNFGILVQYNSWLDDSTLAYLPPSLSNPGHEYFVEINDISGTTAEQSMYHHNTELGTTVDVVKRAAGTSPDWFPLNVTLRSLIHVTLPCPTQPIYQSTSWVSHPESACSISPPHLMHHLLLRPRNVRFTRWCWYHCCTFWFNDITSF